MKKLFKWLLSIVAFLVVLMVLAIILLPMVFDPNDHKPQIQQVIQESIGREVLLNGPIEWSVFPWVAINIKDVSIANEVGFKGDHMAQVEQVAVRVKLLPLLRKQIKVGKVNLQHPQIKLQVAQSGKNNWQSIIAQLETGDTGDQTDDGTTDLEIRGIEITDGELSYKDSEADLEMLMSNLSFQSDAIKADSPSTMSMQAMLKMPEQNLGGQLDMAWDANHLANDQEPILKFKEISFDGNSDGMPLTLDTRGLAVLDLGQDSLTLDSVELNYGVMKISTPVTGTNLSNNMALSGNISMDEFSMASLMEQMGSSLDNEAGNLISGATQWSLTNNRLQLRDMGFKLDDSTVSGEMDIRDLSQLRGTFDFTVNQLNLDHYLPAEESSSAQNSGTDSSPMDLGQLNGQVKMDQLQAAGVKLSDITLKINTQGQDITVEPLNAGFYQGLIKTELKLQPEKATEKLQVRHHMQDFQAGGLLTDLMGTDFLTGLGQLNADINIDQPFSERPLKTANGTISYQLTDGDIVGIDVFQIMQQSLSFLNKSDAAQANSELKTEFGLMEINADVQNGILKTNTLKLNSPYFKLTGNVEIDLDQQTISGTIKPMLTNIPEGVLDKKFEKLLNVRIPVKLKGSVLEPDVSIDVAQLILESQKSKIDEKKEELKEDIFDAILGNKKDKNNSAKDSNVEPSTDHGNGTDEQPELTEKQKKKAKKDQMKRELLEGLFKSKKDKPKDDDDTGGNQ